VHWLTTRTARPALLVDSRAAAVARVLGETGRVAWVTDASGADGLDIGPCPRARSRSAADGLLVM